jgi:hypothetical protein
MEVTSGTLEKVEVVGPVNLAAASGFPAVHTRMPTYA